MLRNWNSLVMETCLTIRKCNLKTVSSSFEKSHPVSGWLKRHGHRQVAYSALPAAGPTTGPGVIFCPGFQSTMQGVKALALEAFCRERGYAFTRFDYQGCGDSEGDIRNVLFSDWRNDVLAVIDNLTTGPQILIGSSMGAWLALLAAVARPHRIYAFIGLASAPDFSQRTSNSFPPEMQKELLETGETNINSEYGHYVVTQRFLSDLPQHYVLTGDPLPITCPVWLFHGMRDRSVPYSLTLKLAKKIASNDIRILLRKNGDHRLSDPQDIQILLTELEALMQGYRTPPTTVKQSAL